MLIPEIRDYQILSHFIPRADKKNQVRAVHPAQTLWWSSSSLVKLSVSEDLQEKPNSYARHSYSEESAQTSSPKKIKHLFGHDRQTNGKRPVKFNLYANDNIPTLPSFYFNLQAMIEKIKKWRWHTASEQSSFSSRFWTDAVLLQSMQTATNGTLFSFLLGRIHG